MEFETNREDIINKIKDDLGLNKSVPFSQMSKLLKEEYPFNKSAMYNGYLVPKWLYRELIKDDNEK